MNMNEMNNPDPNGEIDIENDRGAFEYFKTGGDDESYEPLPMEKIDAALADLNSRLPGGASANKPSTTPAQAAPSLENGDTVVKDGKGMTMFGKYGRVVDQKTGKEKWINTETGTEESPRSVQMAGLIGRGVTGRTLEKNKMTWDAALKIQNQANADAEFARLKNQAAFMDQARDKRVKQNAEMHKLAYGVAKKAYDDLLGGGGVVKETKDGRKFRIVKIDGNMLSQTNADRLKMGRKDAISSVYATIALGKDGETPYGEPRFDFVMEQDGNVKPGGQKQWRTMTLDQVRENYGKALANAGDKGGEDFAKSAFGSWGERSAELAKTGYQTRHPEVNFQRGTGRTFEEQMALEDRRIAARGAMARAERERREGELKDRQIKFIQAEVAKMRGSKLKNVAGAEEPAYTDEQIADRETELYGIFGLEKPQVGKGQEPKPQGESTNGGQAASSKVDNNGSKKWGSLTPAQIEKVKAKGGTYDEKTGEIVLPNGKRMKV